jgi:hypothetical protein
MNVGVDQSRQEVLVIEIVDLIGFSRQRHRLTGVYLLNHTCDVHQGSIVYYFLAFTKKSSLGMDDDGTHDL